MVREHLNDKVVAINLVGDYGVYTPILISIASSGDKIQIFKTLLSYGASFDKSKKIILKSALNNMLKLENV